MSQNDMHKQTAGNETVIRKSENITVTVILSRERKMKRDNMRI